jgi:hypothetical protein
MKKIAKAYPYLRLNHNGTLDGVAVQAYPTTDTISDNYIYIGLPALDIEVDVPSEEQIMAGALKLCETKEADVRKELQGKLIFLQKMKQDLLRIEMADGVEVLDAFEFQQRSGR